MLSNVASARGHCEASEGAAPLACAWPASPGRDMPRCKHCAKSVCGESTLRTGQASRAYGGSMARRPALGFGSPGPGSPAVALLLASALSQLGVVSAAGAAELPELL